MNIPKEFWKNMEFHEFQSIIAAGGLDREQCSRLWRMTDRQDAPPDNMALTVNRRDLERVFPAESAPIGFHGKAK